MFKNQIDPMASAVVDATSLEELSYKDLFDIGDLIKSKLTYPNEVTGIVVGKNFADTVAVMACLLSDIPIALVPEEILNSKEKLSRQIGINQWISAGLDAKSPFGMELTFTNYSFTREEDIKVNKNIAVLLFTSGSTGEANAVALSFDSVKINALQIVDALGINTGVRTALSLSASYSYGFSLITTTMCVSGTLFVTEATVLERNFWNQIEFNRIEQFAGVPWTYHAIKRSRIDLSVFKDLKLVTQAGGNLSVDVRQHFHNQLDHVGKEFIVMYGQTEASPRMSVMPHHLLPEAWDSAGIALKGSTFEILGDNDDSEIVFKGPNVALGTIKSIKDLEAEDQLNGILHTGDVGHITNEGFLRIVGRIKRIAKVNGKRISLDEVERLIPINTVCVSLPHANSEKIFVCIDSQSSYEANLDIGDALASQLGLRKSDFQITFLENIPLLASGKVDYMKVKEVAENA
jgi:long-chain acyl-CoA synthetase